MTFASCANPVIFHAPFARVAIGAAIGAWQLAHQLPTTLDGGYTSHHLHHLIGAQGANVYVQYSTCAQRKTTTLTEHVLYSSQWAQS